MGGKKNESPRFYSGRHAMVSYANKDDIAVIADCCQSFVVDNGAFSIWRRGGTLDINGYIEWVREWHRHPGFDWALIPDVIDGSEEENKKLVENWSSDIRGVPIWHFNESIDYLIFLAENFKFIAFGSAGEYSTVGTKKWWLRTQEALAAICVNGQPITKIHGLRMLDPGIFTRIPFSSADSTNAVQNAGSLSRFGMYLPPSRGQRAEIIAERIEQYNSAPCWLNEFQQEDLFLCGQ